MCVKFASNENRFVWNTWSNSNVYLFLMPKPLDRYHGHMLNRLLPSTTLLYICWLPLIWVILPKLSLYNFLVLGLLPVVVLYLDFSLKENKKKFFVCYKQFIERASHLQHQSIHKCILIFSIFLLYELQFYWKSQ